MEITTIRYQTPEGLLIAEEPMIFSRLYAIGQSLILRSQAYVVLDRYVEEAAQIVVVGMTVICPRCGGIQGKRTPPEEDICIRMGWNRV